MYKISFTHPQNILANTNETKETKEIEETKDSQLNKNTMFLEIVYHDKNDKYTFYITNDEKKASIFETIHNKSNDKKQIAIKYSEKYLGYNSDTMKVTLSENPIIFTIKSNNIIVNINDEDYVLTTSMEFINLKTLDTYSNYFNPLILTKYKFPDNIPDINIVVFDCMGNDKLEIAYLESQTKNKFIPITIFKTANHIFHSRKHIWSMYFGFPALEYSSLVIDLKYQIDNYLSKGHKVYLYGHGYGGAIATKIMSTNQSNLSISHFGFLTKCHMKNLYISTFGSYMLTSNPNVKQYMITGDINIKNYTYLIQPNSTNPHFINNVLVDHLQNVIWIKNNQADQSNETNKSNKSNKSSQIDSSSLNMTTLYLNIISSLIDE